MPRRADPRSVLVLAGDGADLAADAVRACRNLTRLGLRTVLLGSHPAVLTGADAADAVYAEPLTPHVVERVVARERPDAVLAELGGPAAHTVLAILRSAGVPEKYDVEFIGADPDRTAQGRARRPRELPAPGGAFGPAAPGAGPGRGTVLVLGPAVRSGADADHSCREAALALRAAGWTPVLLAADPRTAAATADAFARCRPAPLTVRTVLEAVAEERRSGTVAAVLGQFGGPATAALAPGLADAGAPLSDLPAGAVRTAADPDALGRALAGAGLRTAPRRAAASLPEALAAADATGYPVAVTRPHGPAGTAHTVTGPAALTELWHRRADDGPVLVAPALRACVELRVDALYDGRELAVAGVLEYLDDDHGGTPVCALPPVSLGASGTARLAEATARAARTLAVRGALSVRFAAAGDALYVREAVPGTAHTAPFTAVAARVPLARAAARIALGATLAELRAEGLLPAEGSRIRPDTATRVFLRAGGDGEPPDGTPGGAAAAGPDFGAAYAKYLIGRHGSLPTKGRACLSGAGQDLRPLILPARRLASYGFELLADGDTFGALRRAGVPVTPLPEALPEARSKTAAAPGDFPAVRLLRAGLLDLVLSVPGPADDPAEAAAVRSAAARRGVPCFTGVRALSAGVQAIGAVLDDRVRVAPLPSERTGHDHEEKR
ncbi:hypothetical protein [Streptomyces sp. PsTaAH-124]|uniref:carbamoyl phosphate synthase preATP-grasp domain-containing protein n=1 Tax=Streptomyces sp. PsTaAH-124 TaxID=1157638 RepID=UPI00037D531E|nr:hypothetical protein [Streptomyces sp. PsTaAH-124]